MTVRGGDAGVKTAPETLQMQMNFLNMAMLYIPTQHDAERPKQYFPRNPYPVNGAYPTTPAPIFETPAIFEKLGTDTLFFIFYYQQGTYQQVSEITSGSCSFTYRGGLSV